MQSGTGIRSCLLYSHRPADSLRCCHCTRWCLWDKAGSCHSGPSLTLLTQPSCVEGAGGETRG